LDISRRNERRLAILSVLVALSIGMVVAANSGLNISNNTTSNAVANQTINVSITGISYTGTDQSVTIANQGISNLSLTDWKIMNNENQTYSFPVGFSLKPTAKVRVHTGAGKNTLTDLYNSSLTWNKSGDTAILEDTSGKIVSKYSYPATKPTAKIPTVPITYSKKVITNNSSNTTKSH
jgi:hypothetical protein